MKPMSLMSAGLVSVGLAITLAAPGWAAPLTGPSLDAATAGELVSEPGLIRTVFLLSILAFVPAALIATTSFIRIVIVLAMVRHAFGMPETPPNQVLIALGLFLTIFVMGPTFAAINADALQPLLAGDIAINDALTYGAAHMRDFMLTQVREQDIAMMYAITDTPLPTRPEDVDFFKLVPAFLLNELRVAFTIGFVILLPFLLIELVVASVLLSLGMMMVPPATISLPIKVLMFVLIDGWALVVQGLIGGF